MGSEASLWNTLRKNMKGKWEADRVENPASPGTPDVYYTMLHNSAMGWIELKHAHEWPKRPTTPLKIEHFTKQQRSFIRRHGKAGANVSVLLQVERDYFLLDWDAALQIGEFIKADYYGDLRIAYWKNGLQYEQFIDCIS